MVSKGKWYFLFLTNFLGVFNDNLLKNSVIFIGVLWARPDWLSESQLISLVSACLVLPYLFFSPKGGQLAANNQKKRVFVFFKILEIPVLGIAILSFHYQLIYLAVFSVLVMGILSSLYSPSKYGLIRDIGLDNDVSYGSGGFEMMAFLGILFGTVIASVISDHYSLLLISVVFLGVALTGYWTALKIRVPDQVINLHSEDKTNPLSFMVNTFKFAGKTKYINSSVFGAAMFWLIGSLIQMNLIIHTHNIYLASNTQTGFVMAVAALGIALGTYFAGIISGDKANMGLVLLGILGMILMLTLLWLVNLNWYLYLVVVFVTTFSGGVFQIPHLSFIQNTNLGKNSGNVFAYLNMLTFVLILVGAALFSVITYFTNQNSQIVFLAILLICLFVLLYYFYHTNQYRNNTKEIIKLIFHNKI